MLKWARRSKSLTVDGKKALQYDDFSRQYRMRDLESYAQLVASHTPSGGSVLDVATGPGYFCIALAKLSGFEVTGTDLSADLISIARDNASRDAAEVTFVEADVSAMPFADDSFDTVFCSWAMKNFQDPARALGEMHRVLKPGGKLFVVDVNHDATGQDWKEYASQIGLSGGTALMMGLAFRIQRSGAYSKEQFVQLATATPLRLDRVSTRGINLVLEMSKSARGSVEQGNRAERQKVV
jgi:ubiquinone/menaquinone biosynthesis C-methylase UbiE